MAGYKTIEFWNHLKDFDNGYEYLTCDSESCDKSYVHESDDLEDFKQVVAKWGGAHGDCFRKNHAHFVKMKNPLWKLAIIDLTYTKTKNSIRHCIIYEGDYIIDVSQGKNMKMDRHIVENAPQSPYIINSHIVWGLDDVPSIKEIIDTFGTQQLESWSREKFFTLGPVPKQVDKWEIAKNLVINL